MDCEFIQQLFKARINFPSMSVMGCAISKSHILLPKATAAIGTVNHRVGAEVGDYKVAFFSDTHDYIVLSTEVDLREELGLKEDEFPVISNEILGLGQSYGVLTEFEGGQPYPRPIIDAESSCHEGLHIVFGTCSYVAVPKTRTVRFLINLPEMELASGSPVFDKNGHLCGLIKYGLRRSRLAPEDRFSSAIFEVIPIYKDKSDAWKVVKI